MTAIEGITVVLPVLDGRRHLPSVLTAIRRECRGKSFEIIAVDDGSTDGSTAFLRRCEARGRLRLVPGAGRGPAAAMNLGILAARYSFICQIDQDVVPLPGWLDALLEAVRHTDVAAAQGWYVASPRARCWARVMGHDLEARYRAIAGTRVDHVCTGNTVYRATALHQVGLFDERFGYGADNDLSYRLVAAGYRLAICRGARSTHFWREDAIGYLRQQFGVGYGRLELLWKHRQRIGGDDVSGPGMILHAALMTLAVLLAVVFTAGALAGAANAPLGLAASGVVAGLALERSVAGMRIWRATGDPAALAFPAAHLLRDLAWTAAIAGWSWRRLRGIAGAPGHSMRTAAAWGDRRTRDDAGPPRPLFVIPAHNEAASLPRVVAELGRTHPNVPILVVNDASTDGTEALLPSLGVAWMTLPLPTGVGGAVRAGILYARRRGHTHVIRLDGDGQHRARDAVRLLHAVTADGADAAVGSRYRLGNPPRGPGPTRRALGVWLSLLTGRRVSDPTSGYWAFGPRALALLARHHPNGYPEPELLLLLHRHGLPVREVAVRGRPRLAGRTTLTRARTVLAFGRTALALLIVPLRRAEAAARESS